MPKVFISGAISEKKAYNKRAFNRAERRLTRLGCAVFNPIKLHSKHPERFNHEDYMHVCLSMMECCDTIYMLKGWEESRGAKKEHRYAKTLEMSIEYE